MAVLVQGVGLVSLGTLDWFSSCCKISTCSTINGAYSFSEMMDELVVYADLCCSRWLLGFQVCCFAMKFPACVPCTMGFIAMITPEVIFKFLLL